jgi:hypothetical protein
MRLVSLDLYVSVCTYTKTNVCVHIPKKRCLVIKPTNNMTRGKVEVHSIYVYVHTYIQIQRNKSHGNGIICMHLWLP